MTRKEPGAFRTISEAATELDLPQHVLRHWEGVFSAVRPMRRAGGRRYYRPADIALLHGIKTLLHHQRYSAKGVQKILKDHGTSYVAQLGQSNHDTETHPAQKSTAKAPRAARISKPTISNEKIISVPAKTLRALKKELLALKADITALRNPDISSSLSHKEGHTKDDGDEE